MVIRDRKMQRAHLLSNAFITIEEAPKAYDQIRGTEVVAYFDSTSALTRFDALGGAATLFYLEENDALATVNKVETKMIYATFKDSNIERIYYYDNPKNDGYPTVQMSEDDKTLKGFRWEPEKRPKSPEDITTLKPRSSERLSYLARPHAAFVQTEDYFPGYINKVYRDIAIRDSLEVVRQKQRKEQEALRKELALSEPPEAPAGQADTLLTSNEKLTKPETEVPPLPADTLKAPADTLLKAPVETLKAPEDTLKAPADTLLQALPDTLKHVPDSLQLAAKPIEPEVHEPTPEEIRAAEKAAAQAAKDAEKARLKAEKDRIKAEKAAEKAAKDAEKAAIQAAKDAERQARWEELNRIDAEKRAAKEQKRLEKERARKLKALQKLEKKAQKERERFEKYLQREQEKAAKKAQKAALKQAPKKQNTQD
jgi:colicin import membrane protein